MFRRLLRSVLVALVLAAGFQTSLAAKKPAFLVCSLEDGTSILIVIQNFGGMSDAVRHCHTFWNGKPLSVER